MKRLNLFIIVLLLASQLEAQLVAGKIVLENGRVEGVLDIPYNYYAQQPFYPKLQREVWYLDANDNRYVLNPDEAKEIQFIHDEGLVRMISLPNSLELFPMDENIFLKLEESGRVNLYSYYYNDGMGHYYKDYVVQRGQGKLKRPNVFTFKNDMIDYFSDCSGLVEMIENKEYKFSDLQLIAQFYNKFCE